MDSKLFIEAFRYYAFTDDLAQRRLFEKMRAESLAKDKKQAEETINKAKEHARRLHG